MASLRLRAFNYQVVLTAFVRGSKMVDYSNMERIREGVRKFMPFSVEISMPKRFAVFCI